MDKFIFQCQIFKTHSRLICLTIMKTLYYMGILSLLTSCFVGKSRKVENAATASPSQSIYSISLPALDGQTTINLSDFKGKYLVIVNTASECGYTPQYKDLQAFYEA